MDYVVPILWVLSLVGIALLVWLHARKTCLGRPRPFRSLPDGKYHLPQNTCFHRSKKGVIQLYWIIQVETQTCWAVEYAGKLPYDFELKKGVVTPVDPSD